MNSNSIMVGLRISMIRKNLGETMETFGERFNVGKGTVNNWEKGRSVPKKPTLLLISEAGKVSIEELLYGSKNEYIDYLFSKKQMEIMIDYPFLNKDDIKKVAEAKKKSFLEVNLASWSYSSILKKVNNIFSLIVKNIPLDTEDMLIDIVGNLNSNITWINGLSGGKGLKKLDAIQSNSIDLEYCKEVVEILENARARVLELKDSISN